MTKAYSDEIEKMAYYKTRIMKQLFRSGKVPTSIKLQEQLDKIDTKISLLSYKTAVSDTSFNTEDFNNSMELIAEDLKILYKIVYELSVEKYNKLAMYVDTHLRELQSIADRIERKGKMETSNSSLGETIFMATAGFKINYNNTDAIIDLGAIKAKRGYKLYFIADIENVAQEDIIFYADSKTCSPYSVNADYITTEESSAIKKYKYEIDLSEKINSDHCMSPEEFKPSLLNSYKIYGGLNRIITTTRYLQIEKGEPIYFSAPSKIQFIVKDSTYINMEVSKKPISKTFSDYSISSPAKDQDIFLEVDTGTVFTVNTDGSIYAEIRDGYIKDGTLYYQGYHNLNSYLIEERLNDEEITIKSVKMKVKNVSGDIPLSVKLVAIKQVLNS